LVVKDLEVYGQTGYAITVRNNRSFESAVDQSVEQQSCGKPLPPPYDDSLTYLQAVLSGQVQDVGQSSLETNLLVTEILDAARRRRVRQNSALPPQRDERHIPNP